MTTARITPEELEKLCKAALVRIEKHKNRFGMGERGLIKGTANRLLILCSLTTDEISLGAEDARILNLKGSK